MSEPEFYFNPFDPEFRAYPYRHFAKLLEGPPKQLNLFMPSILVARYADVVKVLHDHERFTVRRPEITLRERVNVFGGAPTILTADPPAHTRLRRLVSKAFTPKRVRELEPRIREIAGELLSAAAQSTELDAMAALANPLPVIVIAELLGVSAADHRSVQAMVQRSHQLVQPGHSHRPLSRWPCGKGRAARLSCGGDSAAPRESGR